MTFKTEVVVAWIGVCGAVLVAIIGSLGTIKGWFVTDPEAIIGPLQQELVTISSEKTVKFAGLEYIARPPTQGGAYSIDALLGGRVVGSHEFTNGTEEVAVLAVGNCNFLQLHPVGSGMGSGQDATGRTTWSMAVHVNIKTTCSF